MKKKEIKIALDALKTIKMPKLEDKETRNGIIADHFNLLGEQKKYEADIEALRTAHLGAYEAEQKEIQELNQELQSELDRVKQAELMRKINSHKEYSEAVLAFSKAIEELGNEEVEIKGIDHEKFMEQIEKQDYDLGLIESLYPMFNI